MSEESAAGLTERLMHQPIDHRHGGSATRVIGTPRRRPAGHTGVTWPAPAPFDPPPPNPPAHAVAPEASPAAVPPARRLASRLLPVALGFWTVSLVVLLFFVYVYDLSSLLEQRAQRGLLNQFTQSTRHAILSGRVPGEGRPAGILTIPAIHLSTVVVAGTSATDLLNGPGLMPGTALPGSLGNSVIAGHRTIAGSPFARLSDVRPGDRLAVVTGLGKYEYRVTLVGSAKPGGLDPISPSRYPRLTLVTSGGTAGGGGRTYVVAHLLTRPNLAHVPRDPPTLAERGLTGDSSAVLPSVFWGAVAAAGAVATVLAYRRYRAHPWSVYMLSTPILLALAFLWYENLIRLLPGTM